MVRHLDQSLVSHATQESLPVSGKPFAVRPAREVFAQCNPRSARNSPKRQQSKLVLGQIVYTWRNPYKIVGICTVTTVDGFLRDLDMDLLSFFYLRERYCSKFCDEKQLDWYSAFLYLSVEFTRNYLKDDVCTSPPCRPQSLALIPIAVFENRKLSSCYPILHRFVKLSCADNANLQSFDLFFVYLWRIRSFFGLITFRY